MTFAELILSYFPAHNKYLAALIVFAVFFILSKAVVYITEKILLSLTSKTKSKLDDEIVEQTNNPVSWMLVFIGGRISMEVLDFNNGLAYTLENIFTSLIYISSAMVIIAVIVAIIDHWGYRVAKKTKSSIDDALVPLFRKTSKVVILIVAALMVLNIWGVDVTGLLAGVGIAGIAIGFAVKDSLANIFGGVSLILDKTFNVGDKVELEDGTAGIVKDVGLRATRIRTFNNEMLIVPNGMLTTHRIKNFNQPNLQARVTIPFSVEYGTDPEKVKKIVYEEIGKMKQVIKDPAPLVRFLEMADFSLNMKAFFWVDDISQMYDAKEEATYRIYKALNKHKIGIPFPTSVVYHKNN